MAQAGGSNDEKTGVRKSRWTVPVRVNHQRPFRVEVNHHSPKEMPTEATNFTCHGDESAD